MLEQEREQERELEQELELERERELEQERELELEQERERELEQERERELERELKQEQRMITLKTLHKASEQEVFDQVAKHLLAQGKKSQDINSGNCVYRSQNGSKCAAGCLMSDFEYEEQFENHNWKRLAFEKLVPGYHVDLIHALQGVHDNIEPQEWPSDLAKIAVKFKLSSDVLTASAGCLQPPL